MNTVCLLLAAWAAVTNRTEELPPVVVEATRLGQTKAEVAAHVDVFDRDAVESSGAQSVPDLLEKRANVFFRRMNANPAQAQVSMRGYGANGFARVKVLADGEELNNPDMAAQDLMRVPVRSVERVEVLHGPQTVLYGSDASAGVINIVSDPDDYGFRTVFDVHGGSFGQVGTHAGTRGGLADEGLAWFGDFDFDRADGWRENGWYELWNVKGGLRKNFGGGSWAAFRTFYADSQYGLPGPVWTNGSDWYGTPHGSWKDGDCRAATTPDDETRNDVYGLTLNGEGAFDDENVLYGEFSFRNRRTATKFVSYGSETDCDAYGYVWKLKYANTSSVGGFANRVDVGTDMRYDLLDVRTGNRNDYSRYSGALFAREEFWLLDALSLFGGVRGEGFRTADTFEGGGVSAHDARTTGAVAGEAGANWRPCDGLKVFARWSRFYHAPLADEMFNYYGVPNLTLRPETGNDVELGVDWTFCDDFNFNLTGFHAELEDEIAYYGYANRNIDEPTARDGFETSLTWGRERVGSAGVLYTCVYARLTDGPNADRTLPMVPCQQLRVFGEVFVLEWLAVGGGYRFVGSQWMDGDYAHAGEALPDYGTFDLTGRILPTWKPLEGLTLAVVVDNLFDCRYADYGVWNGASYGSSVYPACGRSFVFTVRYAF